ncbi:hypothetical protein GE061_005845, partial [Apolygus lucorum]
MESWKKATETTADLADAMTEAMNRMGEFFRNAQPPVQGTPTQQQRDLPRSLFLEIEPWNPDEPDAISAASFFAEVDQATHDLDQEQRLRFLRTRLRGGAKRFLQEDLGAQPYDHLRNAILKWYEDEDPEKAMVRLWTTKRQPEESIRRFAEKLMITAKTAVRYEITLTDAQRKEWNPNRDAVLLSGTVPYHRGRIKPTFGEGSLKEAPATAEPPGEPSQRANHDSVPTNGATWYHPGRIKTTFSERTPDETNQRGKPHQRENPASVMTTGKPYRNPDGDSVRLNGTIPYHRSRIKPTFGERNPDEVPATAEPPGEPSRRTDHDSVPP